MDFLDSKTLQLIFGDAITKDFVRMLFIFAAAAFVHARQVRKEIRAQFGELVKVLRDDLEGQKFLIGKLAIRVDDIEEKLHLGDRK